MRAAHGGQRLWRCSDRWHPQGGSARAPASGWTDDHPDPAATETPSEKTDEPTLGALVHELTQQLPELIRSEMRLAQAEVAEKGKRARLGIGMFSAAGLLAFFAFGSLVATAILALTSSSPPGWPP